MLDVRRDVLGCGGVRSLVKINAIIKSIQANQIDEHTEILLPIKM